MTLQVKLLHKDAKVPTRGSDEAAGYDLATTEYVTLYPMERKMISTGISMSMPIGKVGLIWPRSKLANKHGIQVMAGVVDSDYRGEVKVILFNAGERPVAFESGEKIAQMLIQDVCQEEFVVVQDLDETARGTAGINDNDLRL